MDVVDRKILALVQSNGRLTVTELATQIGLSLSPCHRRLRELERSGAISGYRAVVDPEAVGLRFQALVFVTMRQEDRETLLDFERAVTPPAGRDRRRKPFRLRVVMRHGLRRRRPQLCRLVCGLAQRPGASGTW